MANLELPVNLTCMYLHWDEASYPAKPQEAGGERTSATQKGPRWGLNKSYPL